MTILGWWLLCFDATLSVTFWFLFLYLFLFEYDKPEVFTYLLRKAEKDTKNKPVEEHLCTFSWVNSKIDTPLPSVPAAVFVVVVVAHSSSLSR